MSSPTLSTCGEFTVVFDTESQDYVLSSDSTATRLSNLTDVEEPTAYQSNGSILVYQSNTSTYVLRNLFTYDVPTGKYIMNCNTAVLNSANCINNINEGVAAKQNGSILVYDDTTGDYILRAFLTYDSGLSRYVIDGDSYGVAIKTVQTGAITSGLANGELAYSYSTDKLYIGRTADAGSAVSVEYIGGKLLVDKVANLESVVATLSGGGGVGSYSDLSVSGTLTLSNYTNPAALRVKTGGVIEAIGGTDGEVFQIAANGSPYFDELNGGTY